MAKTKIDGKGFLEYLFKYLIAFSLLFILLVLLYLYTYGYTKETLLGQYSERLDHYVSEIESKLDRGQQVSYFLSESNEIMSLSTNSENARKKEAISLLKTEKLIRRYNSICGSGLVASVLIFPNSNYVVTSFLVSADYSNEYGRMFRFSNLDSISWHNICCESKEKIRILPETTVDSDCYTNLMKNKVVPFVYCVNSPDGRYIASYVQYIDSQWFDKQILDMEMINGGCNISILSQKNGCILGNSQEMRGEVYTLERKIGMVNDISIMLTIPVEMISANTSRVLATIRSVLLIGIIGFVFLIIGYSIKRSIWFRRIINIVGADTESNHMTSTYRYIEELIKNICKTYDIQTKRMMMLENEYLNNVMVNVCIRGIRTDNDLIQCSEILSDFHVGCRVIVLKVNGDSNTPRILFEMETAIIDMCPRSIVLHHTLNESVVIIDGQNAEKAATLTNSRINEISRECAIGISDVCMDASRLHGCYKTAHARMTEDYDVKFISRDNRENGKDNTSLYFDSIMQLQNIILAKKVDDIDAYFETLKENVRYDIWEKQYLTWYIIQQLLHGMQGEIEDNEPVDGYEFNDNNVDDCLDKLKSKAIDIAEKIVVGSKYSDEIIRNIYAIIQREFMNVDLSVTTIAQRMNYSEKHIYRIVKEKTGMTPNEVIDEIRSKCAATLLRTTTKSNSEIAYMCGYKTVTTFYRSFKQRYGISPGEYRKIDKDKLL